MSNPCGRYLPWIVLSSCTAAGLQALQTSNHPDTIAFCWVLIVMAVAGLVGGWAGFLISPIDPETLDDRKYRRHRRRYLVSGVVAAYTVPLFLAISSAAAGANGDQLVSKVVGSPVDYGSWLVLTGFCLVAAVSAPRFLSRLSDQLIEDVSSRVAETRRNLQDMQEDLEQAVQGKIGRVTAQARELLEAIEQHPSKRPTLDQLKKQLHLDPDALKRALNDLEKEGLVKPNQVEGTDHWRVRAAGKAAMAQSPKISDDRSGG